MSGSPVTSFQAFGSDLEDLDAVPANPYEILDLWLARPEGTLPPLMTLSTLDLDGYPDSRHLLMSTYDGECMTFHVDGRSRNVAQIETDPRVSLAVVWLDHGRQLVAQGEAHVVPAEDSAAVYAARTAYLQQLAWVNDAAVAQLPLEERRAAWAAFAETHPEGTMTMPDHWAGFAVRPRRLTFWRGDPAGPSHRLDYLRVADGWTVQKLPG